MFIYFLSSCKTLQFNFSAGMKTAVLSRTVFCLFFYHVLIFLNLFFCLSAYVRTITCKLFSFDLKTLKFSYEHLNVWMFAVFSSRVMYVEIVLYITISRIFK